MGLNVISKVKPQCGLKMLGWSIANLRAHNEKNLLKLTEVPYTEWVLTSILVVTEYCSTTQWARKPFQRWWVLTEHSVIAKDL